MPENIRQTSPRFKAFCYDILVYSKKHYRDFRSVEIRVKKIVAAFGETPVDKIKPADIDAWLATSGKNGSDQPRSGIGELGRFFLNTIESLNRPESPGDLE